MLKTGLQCIEKENGKTKTNGSRILSLDFNKNYRKEKQIGE